MNKARILTLAAVALFLSLATPHAQAYTAAQKFGRGLAGMTCGIMELPGNMLRETRRDGAAGLPKGVAYGLGMVVARELVGVYEFLTAPFSMPAGYRPILDPEYPWDYFRQ